MTEGPQLTNGHDKSESEAREIPLSESIDAAHGAMILRQQITELQITAARSAERATIEALSEDAKRRFVRAREANDPKAEFDALREMTRYELWLSRRGFV